MANERERIPEMKKINKKLVLILCIFFITFSITLADEKNSEGGILQKHFSLFEKKSENKTPLSKKASLKEMKPQAIKIIQQSLSDSDPRIRANAIEIVAQTRQIRLMPKVEKLLEDNYVPVRFAAAIAIGDTQYKLAKDSVKQMLNDPDTNIKIAASYAMVKLGSKDKSYEKKISDALINKDQTIRANAAAILGKLGNQDSLVKLYWVLKDADSKDMVRFQALESIAMLGDEQIIPKIWPTIISSYNDDRVIGIRALGQLGTEKAKEILITKLDDDVLIVRLAAAAQLGRLNDKTGETEVLNVFKNNLTAGLSKSDRERINFFTTLAIGEIATEPLTQNLPGFLENDSKLVKMAAAKAVLQCTKSYNL